MTTINVGRGLSRADKNRAASVKAAIAHMDAALGGRWDGRASAIRSIERSRRPMVEAKRLVEWAVRKGASSKTAAPVGPDFSDVQELRVRIANRDGALACAVHKRMIDGLDRDIARGDLTTEEFAKRSAVILRTPQAWPRELIREELSRDEIVEVAPVDQLDAASGPLWIDRWGFRHHRPARGRQLVITT